MIDDGLGDKRDIGHTVNHAAGHAMLRVHVDDRLVSAKHRPTALFLNAFFSSINQHGDTERQPCAAEETDPTVHSIQAKTSADCHMRDR